LTGRGRSAQRRSLVFGNSSCANQHCIPVAALLKFYHNPWDSTARQLAGRLRVHLEEQSPIRAAMKPKRFLICCLAVIGLLVSTRPAIGAQAWVQRYTGSANGSGNVSAIAVDGNGNVLVAGTWAGDFATIKYSNSGTPLWTNRYHGPAVNADAAHAVAVDRNGNVFVTGQSANTNDAYPYNNDYATIKYSGAGTPLWTNRYHIYTDGAHATAIAVDTNGDAIVTGYSDGSGVATIKYSNAGVTLWTNRFHYAGDGAYATAIAVERSGNVFVTGFANGPGGGDDFLTIKLSGSGASVWTNRYNGLGNGDDQANAIAVDGNGNAFVTGGAAAAGQIEFVTIKYSNTGVPVWTNHYKGPGNSTYGGAGSIAVDTGGNVIVTGASVGSGTYNDFATIKYSNAGVPLWTNRYNRIYDDVPIDLATDRSNNVFVSGYSTDGNTLRFDNAVVAYSSTGALLWSNIYNGPGNDDDSANAIALDGDGNVFVTGYSRSTSGYADIATIKIWGVQPIPLGVQQTNKAQVLNWANPTFQLQSAPAVNGKFTNVPSATSPYTNTLGGSQRYFRLKLN
jgi:hypothetical protein